MISAPSDVQEARSRTAHRARWHEQHKAHVDPPKAKPPEPRPDPTRMILAKLWIERSLLIIRERGFLRQLSWLWWTGWIKVLRWLWRRWLWVRGAYQFVRWRLSRPIAIAESYAKNETCLDCDWLDRNEDSGMYCEACICPKKPRADIRRKNRRSYPHCSKGKHPGSKLDPYAKLRPCVGFGCGSKKNGDSG